MSDSLDSRDDDVYMNDDDDDDDIDSQAHSSDNDDSDTGSDGSSASGSEGSSESDDHSDDDSDEDSHPPPFGSFGNDNHMNNNNNNNDDNANTNAGGFGGTGFGGTGFGGTPGFGSSEAPMENFRDEEDPLAPDGLQRLDNGDGLFHTDDEGYPAPLDADHNNNNEPDDKPTMASRLAALTPLLVPCCALFCLIVVAVVMLLLFLVILKKDDAATAAGGGGSTNNNGGTVINPTPTPTASPTAVRSAAPSTVPPTLVPTTSTPTLAPTPLDLGGDWSIVAGSSDTNAMTSDILYADEPLSNLQIATSRNGQIMAVLTTNAQQDESLRLYEWSSSTAAWQGQTISSNVTGIDGLEVRNIHLRQGDNPAPQPLLQLSAAGDVLLVASGGQVQVLEYNAVQQQWDARGPAWTNPYETAALNTADGRTVIVGRSFYTWQPTTQTWQSRLGRSFLLQYATVSHVQLSPDGRVLATIGRAAPDDTTTILEVWTYQAGAWTRRGDAVATNPVAVSLSHDGNIVAVAKPNQLQVWAYGSSVDDDEQWRARGNAVVARECHSVALSEDGQTLAAASEDGWAQIFGYDRAADQWEAISNPLGGAASSSDNNETNNILPDFTSIAMSADGQNVTLGMVGANQSTVRTFVRVAADDDQTCNGLSCDFSVTQVLFGVAHYAHAATAAVTSLARQTTNVSTALASGLRGLHLAVGYCPQELETLVLIHTDVCALGAVDPVPVLEDVLQFVQDNPTEVLILQLDLNPETGGAVALPDVAALVRGVARVNDKTNQNETLGDYLYHHPADAPAWPTLGELVDANTRVIVLVRSSLDGTEVCNLATGCPEGFHSAFRYVGETSRQLTSVEQVTNSTASCPIVWGVTAANTPAFYSLQWYLQTPSPTAAETMNAALALESHLTYCAAQTGTRPNLLVVDFWDTGAVVNVVADFNQDLVPLVPPTTSPTAAPTPRDTTWERRDDVVFGAVSLEDDGSLTQTSIALSFAGTIMAVSQSGTGEVSVFRLDQGQWTPWGDGLPVTSDSMAPSLARKVFLTDDGGVIVVADTNGISYFSRSGSTWLSSSFEWLLDGACCGAVAMSRNGDTVAAGATVQAYSDFGWQPKGEPLATDPVNVVAVALDATGDHLAVLLQTADEPVRLEVASFEDDAWTFTTAVPGDAMAGAFLVALSGDAKRLAAADRTQVQVWERIGTETAWTIAAQNIGLAGSASNWEIISISMSDTVPARLVVVYEAANADTGQAVQVVELDSEFGTTDWTTSWTIFGTADDEYYETAVLSGFGRTAVLGNFPPAARGEGVLETLVTSS